MIACDTTCPSADARYDAHRVLVVDTDHATQYRMRLIWGSGTSANAISAGTRILLFQLATESPGPGRAA